MFKDVLSKAVNFVKDNVGICVGAYVFVFLSLMMFGCFKCSFVMIMFASSVFLGKAAQEVLGKNARRS